MASFFKTLSRAFLWTVVAFFAFCVCVAIYLFIENHYYLNKARTLKEEIVVNTPIEESSMKMKDFECEIIAETKEGQHSRLNTIDDVKSYFANGGSKASIRFETGPEETYPRLRPHYFFTVLIESPGKVVSVGDIQRRTFDISGGPSRDERVEP